MKFNKISELLKVTAPSLIARIRGRRRETSSRDQKTIVKQAEHIESVVEELGYEIEVKKKK